MKRMGQRREQSTLSAGIWPAAKEWSEQCRAA
jgi:hypothetical protein